MLFREKAAVIVFICIAYILVIDHLTQWGNHLWEKNTGNHARYAVMQKGKVGFINGRGRLVIPMNYEEGSSYSAKGLILARSGKFWGFINHEAEVVVDFQYIWAKDFSQGLAAVARRQKGMFFPAFGFINENGQEAIPLKFTQVKSFTSEGLAAVRKDLLWGYIGTDGNWMLNPAYDDADDFHQNMAAVKKSGKWGYIDTHGTWVSNPAYDEAGYFSQGVAPVKQNGLWGYIDLQGNWIVKPTYTEAHSLSEGFGLVKGYDTVGFVDHKGRLTFYAGNWINARDFSDGLAAVEVSSNSKNHYIGKWGYINKKGDFIIPPRFDWAWDFHGGLARVGLTENDIRRGYVNKKGRMIWDPADWQQSTYFRRNIYLVAALGGLFYLFLLVRYIKWTRRIKKEAEEARKVEQTRARPSPLKPY